MGKPTVPNQVRQAGYICEIANLHVRHTVPVHRSATLEETQAEADTLRLGALALLGVGVTAVAPAEAEPERQQSAKAAAAAAGGGDSAEELSTGSDASTSVIADVQVTMAPWS